MYGIRKYTVFEEVDKKSTHIIIKGTENIFMWGHELSSRCANHICKYMYVHIARWDIP